MIRGPCCWPPRGSAGWPGAGWLASNGARVCPVPRRTSAVQARGLGQMRHQELHLVRQDAAVAQDEVFPQAGHIGRVQQRHVRLLGRAVALAVVAAAAGGDHVHPDVAAFLRLRDDVLARQIALVKVVAAVRAHVAVAREKLAVGEARAQIKRVDARHTARADDAVDGDDRLLAGDGVVAS